MINEYFERFGLTSDFKRYIRLKKKIALLQCRLWLEGKKHLINFIEKGKRELSEMMEKESQDPFEIVTLIEKKLRFQINLRETSVAQFQYYLKLAKNG